MWAKKALLIWISHEILENKINTIEQQMCDLCVENVCRLYEVLFSWICEFLFVEEFIINYSTHMEKKGPFLK